MLTELHTTYSRTTKSIAIWQDNQVFELDHMWDLALVGLGHPIDLVLYQMWEVNMVRKAQPLDREMFPLRCSSTCRRYIGMQLANRLLDEPGTIAPLVHHLSTPVDAPPYPRVWPPGTPLRPAGWQ